jgi:hypothetical protein
MCNALALSRKGTPTLQSLTNHFLFEKNTHFHPNLLSVQISKFGRTGKKSLDISDPLTSIEGKKQGL